MERILKTTNILIFAAVGFVGFKVYHVGPKMSHESMREYIDRLLNGYTNKDATASYKRVADVSSSDSINAFGSLAVGDNVDMHPYFDGLFEAEFSRLNALAEK